MIDIILLSTITCCSISLLFFIANLVTLSIEKMGFKSFFKIMAILTVWQFLNLIGLIVVSIYFK